MSRSRRQWGEDSTVRVELSQGASVTLSYKGNLFDLTQRERELITALSTVVQNFKAVEDFREAAEGPIEEAQRA